MLLYNFFYQSIEMKFGIISDLHGEMNNLRKILGKLKDVDGIILNGDLISRDGNPDSIIYVLRSTCELEKDTYVIPGSHEPEEYIPYVKTICEKYSNLTDMLSKRKVKLDEIELVSLPGSDWIDDGYFSIDDEYIKDLENLLNENSILISHIPPYGVNDIAKFVEINGRRMPAHYLEKLGIQIPVREEHSGNKTLKEVIEKTNPKLVISGHIHESPGIKEINGTKFINPGPGESGYFGIVTIDEKIECRIEKVY